MAARRRRRFAGIVSSINPDIQSELRAPMAQAVIGGLIASTLLTLTAVPFLYSLLDDPERQLFRKTPAQSFTLAIAVGFCKRDCKRQATMSGVRQWTNGTFLDSCNRQLNIVARYVMFG
jgi:hypothetical protein